MDEVEEQEGGIEDIDDMQEETMKDVKVDIKPEGYQLENFE